MIDICKFIRAFNAVMDHYDIPAKNRRIAWESCYDRHRNIIASVAGVYLSIYRSL